MVQCQMTQMHENHCIYSDFHWFSLILKMPPGQNHRHRPHSCPCRQQWNVWTFTALFGLPEITKPKRSLNDEAITGNYTKLTRKWLVLTFNSLFPDLCSWTKNLPTFSQVCQGDFCRIVIHATQCNTIYMEIGRYYYVCKLVAYLHLQKALFL